MMEGIIKQGLEQLGLSGAAAPQLAEYGRLLLEKNQVMNLTAITEPEQVARLHMLDCAALLGCAQLEDETLIDVGTGAGFPGLVLKILVPSLRLTLLDSQEKRLAWLEQVCAQLGITGVSFVHARAEEQAHDPAFRGAFRLATARAVAAMSTLCELCLPYLEPGGRFLAMKSVESDEEVARAAAAIEKLGGRPAGQYDYLIPGTQVRHRVVLVEKTGPTLAQFPRRWAKIQKSPL